MPVVIRHSEQEGLKDGKGFHFLIKIGIEFENEILIMCET